MNEQKSQKIQALAEALETRPETAGFSLKGVLEKLPSWALIPLTILLFGLLLTDTAIADPLPFVDEAALFYALLSSMRVLGARRKAKKALEMLEEDPEIAIDVVADPVLAPGQPSPQPAR